MVPGTTRIFPGPRIIALQSRATMDRDSSAQASKTRPWTSTLVGAPSVASLLCTILFMAVCFGIFRPGYAINDDLQIISIPTGYPVGAPAPFLVFSNVLLGFLLVPLYALETSINWAMLLLSGVNLISVWAVLYVLFTRPIRDRHKVLGTVLILSCAAYFALNVTFTSVAALAGFAGLCLLLAATCSPITGARIPLFSGIALLLTSSLIRIEMLALVLPVFLPALVFAFRPIQARTLLLASTFGGLLVLGAYGVDKLYVRANPAWNVYYFYNKTAQMLQDAHRLDNAGTRIRRVGWTGNDQELFARSFFPDPGIYSIDRIKFLVEHVPGSGQNPAFAVGSFLGRLARPTSTLFLLAIGATWLWWPASGASRNQALALVSILVISLVENLGLIWYYKNPDYVLWALLAQTAILEVLVINWRTPIRFSEQSASARFAHGLDTAVVLLIAATGAVSLTQSVATTSANLDKRQAYSRILGDLQQLQADGKISRDALIVSPAHGLPMEWSNPFILQWPPIPYLDLGWMTFSPHYEAVLNAYGIQSLADALYQKDNVFLMTRVNFTAYLGQYYKEHENIVVEFQPVYAMPNPYHFVGYDGIFLYKVTQSK